MTNQELQYQFGQQMNQFDSALELSSDDIEYWLNRAQLQWVKTRFNGLNRERISFEQNQQRIDDLRILIKPNHSIDTEYRGDYAPDNYYIDSAKFPEDYMFLLSQKSKVFYKYPAINFTIEDDKRETQDNVKTLINSNRYSQTQTIYNMLSDPFNTTKADSPLTVVHEDFIDVYTDKSFIVDKVIIDYLRLPKKINLSEPNDTIELPKQTHEEIIQLAVDLFLQNTRELKQRLQRETPVAEDNTQNTE